MKFPSRRPALSIALVCALVAIIITLGVLQVRWTGQVSQANRERLRANLDTGVLRFRRDFNLQLQHICWAFQSPAEGAGPETLKFYAGRYDDWLGAAARPDLVETLFVWDRKRDRLMRLDATEERFKPVQWPRALSRLRSLLESDPQAAITGLPPGSTARSWTLFEEFSVIFHPFLTDATGGESSGSARFRGGVIVTLNMDFIWQKLVPELAGRYFRGPSGSDYRVAIIAGENPARVLYQSSPALAGGARPIGDVVEDLVSGSSGDLARRRAAPDLADETDAATEAPVSRDVPVWARQSRKKHGPLLAVASGDAPWRLVVRHRSGSVEAAVASLRRRNLAVSLGVLFLLAVSIALIVLSAQRAQRLATLQMDFVAGVSHELRTPLAVICAAAENLADGVVGATGEVRNYGVLIRDEGRRLSEMVGNILCFAADRAGRREYQRRPLDIAEVVDAALAIVRPALDSGQVTVEKDVQPGAGFVLGDSSALTQCVQNLLSNAIKYGGAGRWLGVRSEWARCEQGGEVRVTVEDRGLGIDPQDLPHIFEPFYRGKNGGNPRAHGTGLGLSLTKDIAEAMGGRLSVETAPGRGSRFTLHLPALEVASQRP